MVLSVSAGWDATRALVQAYERPAVDAPWAPVGPAVEAALGRTGLAWGRGLHPPVAERAQKREGDGRSPAGVFDLRLATGYEVKAPRDPPRLPHRDTDAALRRRPALALLQPARRRVGGGEGLGIRRGHAPQRRAVPRRRVGRPRRRARRPRRRQLHLHSPAARARGRDVRLHGARRGAARSPAGLARSRGEAGARAAPRARVPGASRRVGVAARPRPRDLGLRPGVFSRGRSNAITDVAGVKVGQVTIVQGEARYAPASPRSSRTAGTCSRTRWPGPSSSATRSASSPASTQVHELGDDRDADRPHQHARGRHARSTPSSTWTLARPGNGDVRSVNALVGETNDGWA